MRFDAGSVLLGLVALGSLPESSGRVLYGYNQPNELDQFHNVTQVARAVAPVKPPPVHPVDPPIAPGDRTSGNPEPAPLTPGDGTPNNNNPEPAPLRPGDNPDAPTTNPDRLTPENNPKANPADDDGAPTVCKRSGECDWSSDEARHSHYRSRGRTGYARVRDPGDYPTTNWGGRLDNRERYTFQRAESPEVEPWDTMRVLGREQDFSTSPSDWDTFTSRSRHPVTRNGRRDYDDDMEDIIQSSYSRRRHEREGSADSYDEVAFVTHDIYGTRDRNRYRQTANNDVERDPVSRRPLDADNYDDYYVPAAQQLHEGYRRSRAYDPSRPPRGYSMVSENVANTDSVLSIREAFNDLAPGARRHTVRSDSTGSEYDHFERLIGNENNYPYLNVASRNEDYRGYNLDSVDIYSDPPSMSMNYRRR